MFFNKIKNLKSAVKAKQEMVEHYESLFRTSVSELKFKNILCETLLNSLDRIDILAQKQINPELLKKFVKLSKEQYELEKLIHYDLVNGNK